MIAPVYFDSRFHPLGILFRSRRDALTAESRLLFRIVQDLSIAKLCGETPLSKQRRHVRQWMQQLPHAQRHVILDVSDVPDECTDLVGLISTLVSDAHRYRLSIVLAGVSLPKFALLELTRLSHVVPCYNDAADAIHALLTSKNPSRVGVA